MKLQTRISEGTYPDEASNDDSEEAPDNHSEPLDDQGYEHYEPDDNLELDEEAYQSLNPTEFAAYITSTFNFAPGTIMVSEQMTVICIYMQYIRGDSTHSQPPRYLSCTIRHVQH